MPSMGLKKKKKDEENPAAEVVEEGGAEEGQEEGKKSKKKSKGAGGSSKLIMVVLIVVLVAAALFAGGVAVTRVVLPSMMADMKTEAEYNGGGGAASEVYAEDGSEEEALELAATHMLPDMTIQLAADQNGRRTFAVLTMGVGFTDAKAAAAFEEKSPEIQDAVLSTVMGKTADELATLNDIESLKKVLGAKVTKIFAGEFEKNQIQILITKILVQ